MQTREMARSSGPEPLIVNVCPTGMVPTKAMTEAVPLSVEEIVDDVGRCVERGASIVHLHGRDEDGAPTHRSDVVGEIVQRLRKDHTDLVIGVTCSGRNVSDPEARAEVLDLDGDAKPDLASLTLGSMNFARSASVNAPDTVQLLAARMRDRGIKPELEAFEPGMLGYAHYLVERGVLVAPCYVNILLGNVATAPLTAASLAAFLAAVPPGWTWSLAGIGYHQLRANTVAMALGGHVRVGLEDTIWYDQRRSRLATNAELVSRVVEIADRLERPPSTPSQTRQLLGLS